MSLVHVLDTPIMSASFIGSISSGAFFKNSTIHVRCGSRHPWKISTEVVNELSVKNTLEPRLTSPETRYYIELFQQSCVHLYNRNLNITWPSTTSFCLSSSMQTNSKFVAEDIKQFCLPMLPFSTPVRMLTIVVLVQ